jgi:FkbM family methyltransferase
MKLQRFNSNPQLIRFLRELGCFKNDPFFFIDVGCSGGIHRDIINFFGGDLRAIGFDPLIAEIERLKRDNDHPGITYVDAFVSCKSDKPRLYDEPDCPPQKNPDLTTDFFDRMSSTRALTLAGMTPEEAYYRQTQKIVHTTRTVSLDEYLSMEDKKSVNFIKTDTDGFDYLVLMGAEEILHSPNLLGLFVEVSLHRSIWKADNSFTLVDRFVRKFGFSLYDMEVYRYSRAALPAPFIYDLPAKTTAGQVNWGDVLYFRDYGRPDYEIHWSASPSIRAVLKLACLFEIYGLQDCATELLIKYKSEVEKITALKPLLDMLTPGDRSYDEHMALFEKHMIARDWKGFR